MKDLLKDKSLDFSIDIVQLNKQLIEEKKEFVLSKQIMRSGTAIGALIREAKYGESPKDFKHKLSIALKEANETQYWLELLLQTQFISHQHYTQLNLKLNELLKLLVSSIKTIQQKTLF